MKDTKKTRPMIYSAKVKPKMKNRSANRQQLILLTVAITAALAVGIWLFIAPGVEKQKALAEQNRLLDSITEGGGVITLDTRNLSGDVDFYDEPDDAGPEQGASALDISQTGAPVESLHTSPPQSGELRGTDSADNPTKPMTITGIGVLSIEKISLKLPVVDGVSKTQLKIAVGRVPETAEIGAMGNAVVAGHRSYTYGDYFNRLGEMEPGDIIEYTPIGGETMCFEVYDILIVDPDDQSVFVQPADYSEITLLTCTPVRTATHRLLVRAKLMEGR